jgi:FlaA1/EpsC-like NDP-sugar epimerase
VDISENNMVELVRDIRSSFGYIDGEFATFAVDCGSAIFDTFVLNGQGYDYVLNLSALKHVRSEKDPFTLMRMIDVNIFNTDKTIQQARAKGAKKYFCVSTDKAANPVNMMGASKFIMEMFLMYRSQEIPVSTARFANVAFSDGSLLYGFNRRMEKEQPLSAPNDVRRYFMTTQESGELCLMSCLLGENRDVFFPKLNNNLNLITFSEIVERYLHNLGYEPVQCSSEDEARKRVKELKEKKQYPVFFFKSDTTGEKDFEEFYTENETLDMDRFRSIGIIKKEGLFDEQKIFLFIKEINKMKETTWTRGDLISLFNDTIPNFNHKETGKFLDGRM